jgi:hypothetical protein
MKWRGTVAHRAALIGMALVIAATASASQAQDSACTLVFGHGRNFVPEMPAANAQWNQLNQSFTQAVSDAIAATGRRAVPLVLPVEARDLQANLAQLLQRASAESCQRVVEATVLGEAGTEQLVLRLRLHAIARQAGPPRLDSGLSIGAPELTVQRELPLNHRTLARLMSAELAQQMAAELMDHLPR